MGKVVATLRSRVAELIRVRVRPFLQRLALDLRLALNWRVKPALAWNLVLAVGLATAIVFVVQAILQRPPVAVQTIVTRATRATEAPPAWRTDIYGPASSSLRQPMGVSAAPGRVFVADTGNAQIQVFSSNGQWLKKFGKYGHGPGEFDFPIDVLYRNGRVYVADLKNSRIQVFTSRGRYLRSIPDKDRHGDLHLAPLSLASDSRGWMYVATSNHEILVFDRRDRLRRSIGRGGEGNGELSYPNGVTVAGGEVWVADSNNGRVQVFSRGGAWLRQISGFSTPRGISYYEGKVFVVDVFQHQVLALDLSGRLAFSFGGRGVREGTLNFPNDVAADNIGILYVADRENNRISVWSYQVDLPIMTGP